MHYDRRATRRPHPFVILRHEGSPRQGVVSDDSAGLGHTIKDNGAGLLIADEARLNRAQSIVRGITHFSHNSGGALRR
jgi:hypothetical protein